MTRAEEAAALGNAILQGVALSRFTGLDDARIRAASEPAPVALSSGGEVRERAVDLDPVPLLPPEGSTALRVASFRMPRSTSARP